MKLPTLQEFIFSWEIMLKVLWRNEREKLGKGDKSGLDRMAREDFIEKGIHFVSYMSNHYT